MQMKEPALVSQKDALKIPLKLACTVFKEEEMHVIISRGIFLKKYKTDCK